MEDPIGQTMKHEGLAERLAPVSTAFIAGGHCGTKMCAPSKSAWMAEETQEVRAVAMAVVVEETVVVGAARRLHRPHQQDLLILLHLADRLPPRAGAVALLLLALFASFFADPPSFAPRRGGVAGAGGEEERRQLERRDGPRRRDGARELPSADRDEAVAEVREAEDLGEGGGRQRAPHVLGDEPRLRCLREEAAVGELRTGVQRNSARRIAPTNCAALWRTEKRSEVPMPPTRRPPRRSGSVDARVESAESVYISANASEPRFRPAESTRPPMAAPKTAVLPKPIRKRRATPSELTCTPLMIFDAYTS